MNWNPAEKVGVKVSGGCSSKTSVCWERVRFSGGSSLRGSLAHDDLLEVLHLGLLVGIGEHVEDLLAGFGL